MKEKIFINARIIDPSQDIDEMGGLIVDNNGKIKALGKSVKKENIPTKIEKIDLSGKFENPIVTEIRETVEFYPAEEYHQDYAAKTGKLCYQQLYVMYNYSPIPAATP